MEYPLRFGHTERIHHELELAKGDTGVPLVGREE
jgi:hypothetical protein